MEKELNNQPEPKTSVMRGSCGECRFSTFMAQGPFSAALACRRHPPTSFLLPGPNGQLGCIALFPSMDRNATCGEFEPEAPKLSS